MMRSALTAFLISLALVAPLSAQQPNTTEASFTVDGFDDGNYPLAPLIAAPGVTHFEFAGTPGQPFVLFTGPVSAGAASAGSIGTVDLDPTSPSFGVLLNGAAPVSPLDALALLDQSGAADIPVSFPAGLTGSLGGLQALVMDPASAAGWRLSAANQVTVLPGFALTALGPGSGPATGAQIVTVAGTGFTPGAPVIVTFGPFTAPFATVMSPTMIQAATPAGIPGSTVDVSVLHRGISRTLSSAYTYDGVPYQSVLINEVHTGSPDYVELFNPHPTPVDVSGWQVHSWYHGTTPDQGSPYVFPFGTTIPAMGFLVVQEFGTQHMVGSLPSSISTGNNFWWTGARQVEVALLDNNGLGVDYVHRQWSGFAQAPHLPFPLAWTGSITTPEDNLSRNGLQDTDDVADFTLSQAGTPGLPNPGQ